MRLGSIDLANFCSLWEDFNTEPISPRQLRRRVVDSRAILLLIKSASGQAVGFASAKVHSSILKPGLILEIEALYVVRSFRRRGGGKALLNGMRAVAKQKGCSAIHVSSLRSRAALTFYTSQSFTPYATRLVCEKLALCR